MRLELLFFFSFSLLFEGSLNEALSFNSSCLIVVSERILMCLSFFHILVEPSR